MSKIFTGLALISAILLFIILIELMVLFAGDKTSERKIEIKKRIRKQ